MTGVVMLGKAGEWETIGSLAENSLWDDLAGDAVEGFDTLSGTVTAAQSLSFTLAPAMDDQPWFSAMLGEPEPAPKPMHAVLFTYKVPFHDVPPRKRRGLTGKAYRIARRRFRRQRTAWVRAGRPLLDAAVYLPRVHVERVR